VFVVSRNDAGVANLPESCMFSMDVICDALSQHDIDTSLITPAVALLGRRPSLGSLISLCLFSSVKTTVSVIFSSCYSWSKIIFIFFIFVRERFVFDSQETCRLDNVCNYNFFGRLRCGRSMQHLWLGSAKN